MRCQHWLTLSYASLRYSRPLGVWALRRALGASKRERTNKRTGRILSALKLVKRIGQ